MRTLTIPASYSRRFFAFLVDLLFIELALLGPFAGLLLKGVSGSPMEVYDALLGDPQTLRLLNILAVFIVLVVYLYFVLFEYVLGETPGMMIFNLTRVFEKDSFAHCLLRNLFIIPFPPFQIVLLADMIYLFYNQEGQRLSEYFTHSKVTMLVPLTSKNTEIVISKP